ncbi:spermidine/putrescine transport system permease protein [Sedimentibacter acidaminivorans]|uniref:Spermidine/putrescine transport system permease protein n=2 Tax=Sedimentibacter acidaminivorans TaxID=913099 RepID=A0ABS4GE33_9FIRM|nr:spermidine/putrescine transport system permease protein [Sedimentibacter acidaminivorans]
MKDRTKYFSYPYIVWMTIFIILPSFLVLLYSITSKESNGITTINFTLENYKLFFDPMYINILFDSMTLAAISTLICLILGYPAAYIISTSNISKRNTLLFLCILPMWMNMLLRTYAWMTILGNNGLINNFLEMIGFQKVNLLYTRGATVMGMVYNFIPFMILPIYTALSKMDIGLIEAADDLGADKKTIFRKIILPLSMPGVISGIIMVFMPAVSTFIIPQLLGGNKNMMIGNLIEKLFILNGDWNFGSAISIIMMIIILISMSIMNKFDVDKEGGARLW